MKLWLKIMAGVILFVVCMVLSTVAANLISSASDVGPLVGLLLYIGTTGVGVVWLVKLYSWEVQRIRDLATQGMSHRELARLFKVASHWTIGRIVRREGWANV